VHIKTVEVDLWNYGLDLKFEMVDAIAMSYPLHDDGFLGALRVTVIHKNLVLNWLNTGRTQYVATYAIGGSLVRGTADKTSDIDTFVIIDDTDVKRMSRVELVEKLRGKIVSDFLREATALAGVKNLLSPQVWLLTDFWQRVKDAEPVAFTFIRDGIPLYDKGTFIPWKRLLQMGKIKPSPEAIDLYMKEGDRTEELLKRRMIDSMIDVYYGVLTPAQAMMMLAGQAPPIHKDAPRLFKETFYDKEKLVDMKYVKILEKVVKLFKDYEHGRLNDISGKEIDELRKEGKEFNKMVKELRSKIEKRMQEHEADRVYKEVFGCLEIMFGKKGEGALLKDFELEMVDKGKISKRFLEVAKEVAKIDEKVKSKKFDVSEMQRVIKDASELVNELQEYSQRKELVNVEKGIVRIYAGNKKIEVILTDAGDFVFDGEKIRKIAGGKLVDSSKEEMEKALAGARKRLQGSLSSETLEILKREYGNFAINL
jgi:predicted nucleotidyltransferase/uncharacterized protein (UPF0332 family)